MEKAAKVIRRNSARLRSLNDGCSAELRIAASETADVGSAARSLAESQAAACKHVLQWSTKQANPAIQDVAAQMEVLNNLLSEIIRQYSGCAECFSEVFTRLTEDERNLNRLKAKLAESERNVAKRRNELKKALKKACSEKSREVLEAKVNEAERVRGLQQIELAQQTVETEAVKCIRFKQGIVRLSDAGILFGRQCVSIYKALKEVADQIPDVHEPESNPAAYNGFEATRLCVARVRCKIEQRSPAGRSSRNASHGVTVSHGCDMAEQLVSQLPSGWYCPAAGSRTAAAAAVQVPNADDESDLPPPYSLGWSAVESSPFDGSRQRCSDRGSRRSRAGSGSRSPKDVDQPSFIEAMATSTPRVAAPTAEDAVRADVARTTCGFDVTASSNGYFSMVAESPAGGSSSSWQGCRDGSSVATCSSPLRPTVPSALAGTVVGQSPALSNRPPPTGLASSPAPSSTADAFIAQPVDDSEEGGGGHRVAAPRIGAAPAPVIERPVERQVLYRNVASQALPPTLLCRQASTTSTSSRRSRTTAKPISSPD